MSTPVIPLGTAAALLKGTVLQSRSVAKTKNLDILLGTGWKKLERSARGN